MCDTMQMFTCTILRTEPVATSSYPHFTPAVLQCIVNTEHLLKYHQESILELAGAAESTREYSTPNWN